MTIEAGQYIDIDEKFISSLDYQSYNTTDLKQVLTTAEHHGWQLFVDTELQAERANSGQLVGSQYMFQSPDNRHISIRFSPQGFYVAYHDNAAVQDLTQVLAILTA